MMSKIVYSYNFDVDKWLRKERLYLMEIEGIELLIQESSRPKFIKFMDKLGLKHISSDNFKPN